VQIVSAYPEAPTEYHQFWRSARYRWWRGALAILVAAAAWFGLQIVLGAVYAMILLATGQSLSMGDLLSGKTTPGSFVLNNVAVASAIPVALLTAWLMIGQRPKWLTSVAGGMRWRWMGRVCAVIVPIWLVYTGIQWWVYGVAASLSWKPEQSLFLIVSILLTTPFQAAGEEYLLRGVLARAIGSWIPGRFAALIVATGLSAIVFMLMHGAGDPWLNLFYLTFGVCAALLTWRTGGLEAAIVLHVVNNLLSEASMPFTDISGLFDREAGTGSPWILVDVAVVIGATLLVMWLAKASGVQRRGACTSDGKPLPLPHATPSSPPASSDDLLQPGLPPGRVG
jgi:membrane protease YdiL (CAAX protease family)